MTLKEKEVKETSGVPADSGEMKNIKQRYCHGFSELGGRGGGEIGLCISFLNKHDCMGEASSCLINFSSEQKQIQVFADCSSQRCNNIFHQEAKLSCRHATISNLRRHHKILWKVNELHSHINPTNAQLA